LAGIALLACIVIWNGDAIISFDLCLKGSLKLLTER
jgi:hypothetical protein